MTNGLGLAHRAWRQIPAAPRRALLRHAGALIAPRADATPPEQSRGIVIAGEMSRISGLGVGARILRDAISGLGVARGTAELGLFTRPVPNALPPDAAVLLHVNAPSLPLMLARAPRDFLRGRRVIGFWNWELEAVPPDWLDGAPFVHEIWTSSSFTAQALERLYPGRVRRVPYPLAALPLEPADPDIALPLDLPDNAVVTTVIANLGASFARKNPLAAILAHRDAFGDRPDRILVLKLAGGAAFPEEMGAVRAATRDLPNIRVIDEVWSDATLRALLARTDILLSLHRAEGFGLVPAEAMLRGIAVVATGWSGTRDFMDEDSAALIEYRLAPVPADDNVYHLENAVWAEPYIAHAVEWLRRLADEPALRADLAARGQAHARAALGVDSLAAALAANGIG